MDAPRKTYLEAAGIDVDEALERFMGNEALMTKFLLRFPEDPNFPQLKQALAGGDGARAFEAAHALKGVVGNLSMKKLFQSMSVLVEDLRAQDLAAAAGRMPELEAQYNQMVEALKALL